MKALNNRFYVKFMQLGIGLLETKLQSLKGGKKTKLRVRRCYFSNLNVFLLLTDVAFFSVSRVLPTDMHHSVLWQSLAIITE